MIGSSLCRKQRRFSASASTGSIGMRTTSPSRSGPDQGRFASAISAFRTTSARGGDSYGFATGLSHNVTTSLIPAMRGDGRIYKRRGSNHWWIAYNHHGKELRESSQSAEYRDAQKLLKRRQQELGAETLGLQTFIPHQDRITVDELLDQLEHDYKLRGKYSASITSHLQRARNAFGHYRATKLTPKHIDTFIEAELEAGRAPATINRSTQLVGQAFNLALRRRELNTKPYIRKLPEKNTREGFFEHDELERVITHLPEYQI